MLTILWDEAREVWKDKRIVIQAEGTEFRAWQGTIRASYYEPISLDIPKPYPHSLRIVYDEVRFTDEFPNWRKPLEKWTPCGKGPRIILETRYLDLAVTDNVKNISGGDLWCMFNISQRYQRPSSPRCTGGYILIKLGEAAEEILKSAKKRENVRALRF